MEKCNLSSFLSKNLDAFAWSGKDLKGLNREIIEHALNIDPRTRPRKQKLRKMSNEQFHAARDEIQRLLDAKVIREVKYTGWLANVVLVKKKKGKLRMCIDFMDLNKCYTKDDFPLPRIDTSLDKAHLRANYSLYWIVSRATIKSG